MGLAYEPSTSLTKTWSTLKPFSEGQLLPVAWLSLLPTETAWISVAMGPITPTSVMKDRHLHRQLGMGMGGQGKDCVSGWMGQWVGGWAGERAGEWLVPLYM